MIRIGAQICTGVCSPEKIPNWLTAYARRMGKNVAAKLGRESVDSLAVSALWFARGVEKKVADWVEVVRSLSPYPCVEVQVYRAREDDSRGRCTEFLETLCLPDWATRERLETDSGHDLEAMIPFETTKSRWGGGDYQFRFQYRDAHGNVLKRRSRNASIEGPPIPKG